MTLIELIEAKLRERAEFHVRSAYPCRKTKRCRACTPENSVGELSAENRVHFYMATEREQIVDILCALMDEGFVKPDDLRDHSDD